MKLSSISVLVVQAIRSLVGEFRGSGFNPLSPFKARYYDDRLKTVTERFSATTAQQLGRLLVEFNPQLLLLKSQSNKQRLKSSNKVTTTRP